MDNKNRKVTYRIVDEIKEDKHFDFVQSLAKNFDTNANKTEYKRSSLGSAVSTSNCSSKACISINNKSIEVSNDQQYQTLQCIEGICYCHQY